MELWGLGEGKKSRKKGPTNPIQSTLSFPFESLNVFFSRLLESAIQYIIGLFRQGGNVYNCSCFSILRVFQ